MIGRIALIIYPSLGYVDFCLFWESESQMIAHFDNIEKDWRSKAGGRKYADRMCTNSVGQPGCWLSNMVFLH